MYCIGLTGNIASGKSTVAALFAQLGSEVISADRISRELTKRNQPPYIEIVNHFGDAILNAEDELNRKKLREIISKYPEERIWLEELLHPLIRKQIEADIQKCESPYCVIEIPLIPDKLHYPYLNRILLILTDPEEQIERIINRDEASRSDALAMLALQADEHKHRAIADDVLMNNKTLEALEADVQALHLTYLKLAQS